MTTAAPPQRRRRNQQPLHRQQPLELQGVTLRLGAGDAAVTALDEVELAVGAGEVLAVVGPSGSGKSSLLAVAGALARPDEGAVRIEGREITGLSDRRRTELRRRRIGYVFQHANLLASLTVREQLLLTARLERHADGAARARADELIEAVGLAHRADRRRHQLSGGERQRVGLARALMAGPAVLLLDEPTSALDRARAAQVAALIAEQTRLHGTATVLVTHDTGILGCADRVREMRDGRLT
jgi:putative ABC transport system ATP-binding protein